MELPPRRRPLGGRLPVRRGRSWKTPLRAALDRLAGGDRRPDGAISPRRCRERPTRGPPATRTSTWSSARASRGVHRRSARRRTTDPAPGARPHRPHGCPALAPRDVRQAHGWYWDDPVRPETAGAPCGGAGRTLDRCASRGRVSSGGWSTTCGLVPSRSRRDDAGESTSDGTRRRGAARSATVGVVRRIRQPAACAPRADEGMRDLDRLDTVRRVDEPSTAISAGTRVQ